LKKTVSRREFLLQSLAGLGVAMMPYPFGIFARAQTASKGVRQHLINICDMGGWNSNLFFNYFDPNLNSLTKDSTPESASLLDGRIFYPTGTSVEYNGAKFAPGMKFWTSDDLGKSCIWRGALSPIGH